MKNYQQKPMGQNTISTPQDWPSAMLQKNQNAGVKTM
jgi:hypothetical protein